MIIFIAMPTKGSTDPDSAATGKMKEAVYVAMAKLHEMYPQYTFVAPMVQDYQLLRHLSVSPKWEVWGDRCRRLIQSSSEVWILMFDGWTNASFEMDEYNTSVGVRGEIEHALKHDVPIIFVDPVTLNIVVTP